MSDVFIAILLFVGLILSVMAALMPSYMLLRSYYSWEAEIDIGGGYEPSKMAEFIGFDKEWYEDQIKSGKIKPRVPRYESSYDIDRRISDEEFIDAYNAGMNYMNSKNNLHN